MLFFSNNLLHHVCMITHFLLVCDISASHGDKYGLCLLGYEYYSHLFTSLIPSTLFRLTVPLTKQSFLRSTSHIVARLIVRSLTSNFLLRVACYT